MAGISVTPTYKVGPQTLEGVEIRYAKLAASGLTVGGSNDVTHGLPATPWRVWSDNGSWSIGSVDSSKIVVVVDAGGADAANLYCEF